MKQLSLNDNELDILLVALVDLSIELKTTENSSKKIDEILVLWARANRLKDEV